MAKWKNWSGVRKWDVIFFVGLILFFCVGGYFAFTASRGMDECKAKCAPYYPVGSKPCMCDLTKELR